MTARPIEAVRIHIDRIVVHGAPDVRADRFGDALITELRRLATVGAPPVDTTAELSVDLENAPLVAARAVAAVVHSRLLAEAVDG